MTTLTDSAESRYQRYRALNGRNRFVSVLRIAVPLIGLLAFGTLLVQLYITSLARGYGFGNVSIDRNQITVETPQYAGVMLDGTTYKVSAGAAQSSIGHTEVIEMVDAEMLLRDPKGVVTTATAPSAQLQTNDQVVIVAGTTTVSDTTGITGTMIDSFIDWQTQSLKTAGAVHFNFPDGSTLDATTMERRVKDSIWSFSGVTLSLPSTPGAKPQ
jgi:lipopolysaccharide export system protein LptC